MRKGAKTIHFLLIVSLIMAIYPVSPYRSALAHMALSTTFIPSLSNAFPLPLYGVDGRSSFDHLGAANVRLLRLNTQLSWAAIEAEEGVYDWSKAANVEKLLIDASKNGLSTILLVNASPVWARKYPASTCGPIRADKYASFGNFLYLVVQRYSQPPYNVEYFQVWNEPDGFYNETEYVCGCWGEDSDETYGGKAFGEMLAQVYPRLKAADHNAQLVMGSLMLLCDARDPYAEGYCSDDQHRRSANFFKGVVEAARNSFDVVMFNSGTSYVEGQNPIWGERSNWRWKGIMGGLVNGKIDYLRGVMAAYGVDKPIIQSEAYLLDRPADPAHWEVFEEQKADYLVWVYANGWSQNLKGVVWYSIEGWKGSELIVNGKDTTKAYQALMTMINLTQRSQYLVREDDPAGFSRFYFGSAGEDIWLLIPTGIDYAATYDIPKPENFLRAVDVFGQEQIIEGDRIEFSHPIYVFVKN